MGFSVSGDQTQNSENYWAGVTRTHVWVFIACWLGGIFDGLDSTLYAVVQHDAISDVLHTTSRNVISATGSGIMSVFLLGWVLGGIAFGVIGDRFGRVRAMVLSILLYALFTGAAGFANTPEQLAICRFLTGFGIGGELVTIATMLSETWPERSRALAVGSLITSYQAGVFLAGFLPGLVYAHMLNWPLLQDLAHWRVVFFIGALPALLAVVLRLKLKESDKWLESKAATADSPAPVSLSLLFESQNRRHLWVGAIAFGGLLIGYWASLSWIPTWIQDLLSHTPMTSGTEKTIATQFNGLGAIIGCLLSGLLANAIGRRWTIMLAYAAAFAVSFYMFTSNPVFTPALYWQTGLLGCVVGIGQGIMYVYLPELFPTRIRATAVGFCLNAGRAVTAIAVLFVGSMVAWFGGYDKALLIFSGSYLIAVVAGFLGEETRHQGLPD